VKIGFDNALGPHAHALQLRADRTTVLARNIANADTPGYLAKDLDFRTELARRMGDSDAKSSNGIALQTTRSGHIQAQSSQTLNPDVLKYRTPLMPSFDGNTVDVQTEQAEFAQNNLQFQASLRFLDGKFKGMISALKGE
jgi:flagellar basal-body rod protein FlgB